VFSQEFVHGRKRIHEDPRHLFSFKISGSQNESADACVQQSGQFQRTIANSAVLRKDNPTVAADLGKPIFIFGILRKVILMDVHQRTRLSKSCGDERFS